MDRLERGAEWSATGLENRAGVTPEGSSPSRSAGSMTPTQRAVAQRLIVHATRVIGHASRAL